MGSFFSSLFSSIKTKEDVNIIMIGLDNAGKTTIMYKLKLNETIETVPTISFNHEVVKYKNIEFKIWDLAGQDNFRKYWKSYYQGTKAIIYVVDSSDKDRIQQSKIEFDNVINEDSLKGVPIAVFANKSDIKDSMTPNEISEVLQLNSIKDRSFSIFKTSATKEFGIKEGMNWIVDIINQNI